MKIRFKGEIRTEVELPIVFEEFKKFMIENLQNYSFSMSDNNETLEDEYHKPKEIEEKEVKKHTNPPTSIQEALKEGKKLTEKAGEKIADDMDKSIMEAFEGKVNTKTIHADAIIKIDEPKEKKVVLG